MSSVHRAWLGGVTGFVGASALIAACAGSEDELPGSPPADDGGGGTDRSVPDADAGGAIDSGRDARTVDACTSAGWCAIDVDDELAFMDLWPLEGSMVALAARKGHSSVVHYQGGSWTVLHEVPFLLKAIWASETDVWVAGGEAGYVAHGHRDRRESPWTWTESPIAVPSPVTAIWGTGEQEIYALADARVWRSTSGVPGWTSDFGGAAPGPDTTLVALVGTSKDDLWVTGKRGSSPACGLIAHKTGGKWVTLVDGTPNTGDPWGPTPCLTVGSAMATTTTFGMATATAAREIVAITDGNDGQKLARIRLSGSAVEIAPSELTNGLSDPGHRRSLWGASADDLYIAGFSRVVRGRGVWDGGDWQISTVSFTGLPLGKPFYVVRGRGNDDIWLAGESYVFHKTSN